MRWFRRDEPDQAPPPPEQPDPRAAIDRAERLVNRSAGRLPAWATVEARWLTDTLRTILDTATQHTMEVNTVILVTATAADYLPTTIGRYAALDDSLRDRPLRDGRTPADHLRAQLSDLRNAAIDALAAVRDRDVDALQTQGNFLRTKFSRSDLDLA